MSLAGFMNHTLPALRRARCVAVAACLAAAAAGPAPAQEVSASEQRVKAAFLYKFAGYIDWPAAAFARRETPFTIAVVGSDVLAEELTQAVSGRTVNERAVAVKRMKPGESLDGVHMLFVARPESARLAQFAQDAQPRAVLMVSESEGALAHGSVINFVLDERRVRFDISLDSAEKSRLRLSSRLLAVARVVRAGGP